MISPGAIYLGEDRDQVPTNLKPEAREEFVRRFGDHSQVQHWAFQPLEMVGKPIDIAYLAVYLASDEARFVTGQEITVDGGLTTYLAECPRDDLREKRERVLREMEEFITANSA